jgi:hypothetical protein
MQAHNYPLIIEFLVIVLIINKVVAIEVFSLFKQRALLACLGLTSILGF